MSAIFRIMEHVAQSYLDVNGFHIQHFSWVIIHFIESKELKIQRHYLHYCWVYELKSDSAWSKTPYIFGAIPSHRCRYIDYRNPTNSEATAYESQLKGDKHQNLIRTNLCQGPTKYEVSWDSCLVTAPTKFA